MGEQQTKLSRNQVAERIGVTPRMVAILEQNERIKAHRVEGRVYYEEADVVALMKVYKPDPRAKRQHRSDSKEVTASAAMAAKVFACFKRGLVNVGEIVLETGARPEVVKSLWTDWSVTLPEAEKQRKAAAALKELERKEREAAREKKSREFWARKERLARIKAGAKPSSSSR